MGYGYGIQQARNALLETADGITYHEKLTAAISELSVIEKDDVTEEYFAKIEEWVSEFENRDRQCVDAEGQLQENDSFELMKNLLRKLIWLCFDICETNTKLKMLDENDG